MKRACAQALLFTKFIQFVETNPLEKLIFVENVTTTTNDNHQLHC